jgi:hypothetical protein
MAEKQKDTHIECVSDFCGNRKSPGAWADIFQRPDGTRYIGLGGAWQFYAENCPEIIEQNSPHYAPFLAACATGEDFGYAAKHWPKKTKK